MKSRECSGGAGAAATHHKSHIYRFSQYMRFTHRTGEKIMSLLRRRSSMKDVAKDTGTSVSGVQRVLKMMPVSKPQRLPEAISFDEFKGNTGGQRFQCIVTDPLNHRVFDILPARTVGTIQDYLLTFPNLDEVKYVVMDKNRGFRDAARAFLPNAQIIIDRFHVVRFCTEAMDNVRRSFQSVLPSSQRKVFQALKKAAAGTSEQVVRRGSRRCGRHAPLLRQAHAGLRPERGFLRLHGRAGPGNGLKTPGILAGRLR